MGRDNAVLSDQSRFLTDDYVRAYARSSIAAAQGHTGAKKGKEIAAKLMTPTQIAEAQKLSREYWKIYVVPFQKE